MKVWMIYSAKTHCKDKFNFQGNDKAWKFKCDLFNINNGGIKGKVIRGISRRDSRIGRGRWRWHG